MARTRDLTWREKAADHFRTWRTDLGPASRVVDAPWLEVDVLTRPGALSLAVRLPQDWRRRLDSPIHVVNPATARLQTCEIRGSGPGVSGVLVGANEFRVALPDAERRLCRIIVFVQVVECRWLPIGRMGTWPVEGERTLALRRAVWLEQERPSPC